MNVVQDEKAYEEFKMNSEVVAVDTNENFLNILREVKDELEKLDKKTMEEYVKLNMVEEQAQLLAKYKEEFKDTPDDDPIKIKVIELLVEIFMDRHMLS